MKYEELKKRYPKFIYQNYSYRISKNNLEILFDFKIEPNIFFQPKVVIENINKFQIEKSVLNNLIFHLGLMEIPSYWKATCSPIIEIRAGYLNQEQIRWWKDLIIKGMGQFFYENKINFRKRNFLKIINQYKKSTIVAKLSLLEKRVLVPVGGGKDSAVTLEILKQAKKELSEGPAEGGRVVGGLESFSLNPTEAALKIMKIAGCKRSAIVRRKIDEKLLELNRRGFLNGHTPFSAYLAFLSVLVATIFGQKYIAFSNERSSNEGNVKYLGKVINHQWSKSFEFEEKFRKYSKKYLTPEVDYFSFLRPLYEIQIAKLFSKYLKYFPVFLSCNVAYQTASGTKKPSKKWCGNCPKCLFVFATLYPFTDEKKLIKIWGQNLFEKRELLPIMQELIGKRKFKPFECVGTKKESLVAFHLSWRKFKNLNFYPRGEKVKLPYLLNYFEKKILPKYPNLEKESKKLMNCWNNQHNLPKNFKKILQLEEYSSSPSFAAARIKEVSKED